MRTSHLLPLLFTALLTPFFLSPAFAGPEEDLARIDYELTLEQYRIVSMKLFEATLHMETEPNEEAERMVVLLHRHKERLRSEIRERGKHLSKNASASPVGAPIGIPDGNYVVKLRLSFNGGQDAVANYQIKGGRGRIVAATQSGLINATGEFRPVDGGGFGAFFKNESFGSTQIWKPRDDGSIHILEIPDRGENQIAMPVDGPTLAWPADNR